MHHSFLSKKKGKLEGFCKTFPRINIKQLEFPSNR